MKNVLNTALFGEVNLQFEEERYRKPRTMVQNPANLRQKSNTSKGGCRRPETNLGEEGKNWGEEGKKLGRGRKKLPVLSFPDSPCSSSSALPHPLPTDELCLCPSSSLRECRLPLSSSPPPHHFPHSPPQGGFTAPAQWFTPLPPHPPVGESCPY